MANEELIYRITRAVYERLGADADEQTVSNLVTDIYRAVEPEVKAKGVSGKREAVSSSSGSNARGDTGAGDVPPADDASASRLVVSVFGVDRPGIVASVSQVLADAGCSIVDINQTVVRGKFAMVMIADTRTAKESAAELKARFRQAGERIGIRIYAQREDLFNAMHRI
ncbi:MAG: ACT domain-containing protein [Pyrinomonadaceae bacterium MAG19_C2-C3]|nr:ACT domain-containing protein [Pyrinomonadaceae bacterium MAG19_C2-C3]